MAGIQKSRAAPYHPMGNVMVERFNQMLLNMLGTLEDCQKSDWKAHIPALVHAYNATRHDSTGYSPHYLMFGRHPRLAIDAFLGLTTEQPCTKKQSRNDFVVNLQNRLRTAYVKAKENAHIAAQKNKAG